VLTGVDAYEVSRGREVGLLELVVRDLFSNVIPSALVVVVLVVVTPVVMVMVVELTELAVVAGLMATGRNCGCEAGGSAELADIFGSPSKSSKAKTEDTSERL